MVFLGPYVAMTMIYEWGLYKAIKIVWDRHPFVAIIVSGIEADMQP
jgi:hypothetical protein